MLGTLVLGERRNAEGVVHEHLVVALRDAHRREDGAGRVRAHQQIDLVRGDELLVHGARDVGFGLVVFHRPFHFAPEQAAARVELLDVDFADQLVRHRGGRERPGQRQGAADADRRLRGGAAGEQGRGESAGGEHQAATRSVHALVSLNNEL
jgi:hypothetical protein